MKHKKFRMIRAICLIVMLICLIRIGQAWVLSARHEAKEKEWKEMLDADGRVSGAEGLNRTDGESGQTEEESEQESKNVSQPVEGKKEDMAEASETEQRSDREPTADSGSGIPGEEGGTPILKKYKTLYLENGDMAGWLTVRGTKIDYPVMQCEDDEYYLHHDFEGKDSKYGCLYVRERADLENGTNFVIYGHNMRDGSMFGELDLYLDEAFYREHPDISFDTIFEEHTYEILAVFRSRIYGEKEDVFKYYQFYEAQTEEEFDDFYRNIKELSLYDTGVEAEFGDSFLTLSTCAYHVKDGRLAVVAKRVE